jgi:hypothetical protein
MGSFLGLLLHVLASPFKSQARLEAERPTSHRNSITTF